MSEKKLAKIFYAAYGKQEAKIQNFFEDDVESFH